MARQPKEPKFKDYIASPQEIDALCAELEKDCKKQNLINLWVRVGLYVLFVPIGLLALGLSMLGFNLWGIFKSGLTKDA